MNIYKKSVWGTLKNSYGTELAVFSALIILIAFFAIASNNFFSFVNMMNILTYSSVIGITAMGMTFALISGSLDLSVGSLMALTGMLLATFIPIVGTALAILIALGLGILAGSINGVIVTIGRINPMIATLGTMSIFRGFTYLISNGKSVIINDAAFKTIGRGFLFSVIPIPVVIFIAIYIIGWLIIKKTILGRRIYAIGGNATAAYLAGINVRATRFILFVFAALMSTISGIVMTAQTGTGAPNAATGYELNIVAAAILGGTSLAGGKGSVIGTFIGVLILSTLTNGMTMVGVQAYWQMVAKGAVLILAVLIDVLRGGGYERF